MPIRNQMFPLSRVLNSTGIFRCHSKVELTNDLKGAIVVALVEAPPWFHFNHSKNCGLPDYYIEPANIQSETGWNWYCWGNLWVLFSRQNWFHLNVFQAFFWPRKYGFTLKFSRHLINSPESQKKSASCLRPAK